MADAVRFAIVSHPRCGSHMLASTLESRGDVLAESEPFNETAPQRSAGKSAAEIYRDIFADHRPRNHRAVGFILHRNQGRLRWPEVWSIVQQDSGLRIVLLHRHGQLARYVSNLIACKTNVWQLRSAPATEMPRVHVDADDFIADVRRYEHLYDETLDGLAGHAVLSIAYEQLIGGPETVLAGVQRFLGLEPMPLAPVTLKQEIRPLADAVVNYNELMARLRGTRYDQHV